MSKIIFKSVIKLGIMLFLVYMMIFLPIIDISSQIQEESIKHSIISNAVSPCLNYSTYLGGNSSDSGLDIAHASDGSFYITGKTLSINFPVVNAFDYTNNNSDSFVSKFSSFGSLLWSTYLGGNESDIGNSIAVTNDGSCYVTGTTSSNNFPTKNAYNNTLAGNADAFVSKFSSEGFLLWSTYLGGKDMEYGSDVTVTNNGECYVIGYTNSSNFPVLNAYNSTLGGSGWRGDVFISKFSSDGSLLWSTFLGGNEFDFGISIDVDLDGSCYLTGYTYSSNFPLLNAFNSTFGGNSDTFITKFSSSGTLLWSTFFGGNNDDKGLEITVTNDNNCYIAGSTRSNNLPVLNAYDSTYNNYQDAFVSKFAVNGSLLWSTYLGGNNDDLANSISVAADGSCFLTGKTRSIDFPTLNIINSSYCGSYSDAFICKFSVNGSLLYSTDFGGSATDYGNSIIATSNSSCIITGYTYSDNFPVINAYNSTINGYSDVFISRFNEISEDTAPTISAINHNPINPTNTDRIKINCTATDANGIQGVKLHYIINNGTWNSGNMIRRLPNIYETNIGPFNTSDIIKYYIEAIDDSPNHNIAIDDNHTNYYQFRVSLPITSTTSSQQISAFGFVTFLFILPILVVMKRKVRC